MTQTFKRGGEVQIFKYPLRVTDVLQTVMLPAGSRVLCAQNQDGSLMLWAMVDDKHGPDPRKFVVVATGQYFDESKTQYIGTVQIGVLVWHVFEVFGS